MRNQGYELPAALAILIVFACICGCGAKHQSIPSGKSPSGGRPTASKKIESAIAWTEMAESAGLEWTYRSGFEADRNAILEAIGGGVALFDYDVDGLLDVFATGGGDLSQGKVTGRPSGLFRNLGDWRFQTVQEMSLIVDASLYTNGCHAGDYDNDGFPDVVVTGYGGLRLYHNLGDGTFDEVHLAAGLDALNWSTSAGWGDLDGDGNLDLYVCRYVDWSFENDPVCIDNRSGRRDVCSPIKFASVDDIVYMNNGDGTFRRAGPELGLIAGGKGLAVLLGDIDLDGDLDIYVANDTIDNFFYLNQDGKLSEQGVIRSLAFDSRGSPNGSMGIDLGDFNGDLKPDLWVANYEEETFALYENIGRGYFSHVSAKTGIESLGNLFVGFGTAFIDADRDGDEDLAVVNGHVIKYPQSGQVKQLPLMLLNVEGKRFERLSFSDREYFGKVHAGRGLAAGDLDNDGRWDMVVSNNDEPLAALRNTSSDTNQWLQVRLIGRTCNRDAVGAWLVLKTSDGRSQLRMVKGGGSYESHTDTSAFWGFPAGSSIQSLEIHWPPGPNRKQIKIQKLEDLTPNRGIVVVEP